MCVGAGVWGAGVGAGLCVWGGGDDYRGCYVIGDKQKNSSQQKISSQKFDVKFDVTVFDVPVFDVNSSCQKIKHGKLKILFVRLKIFFETLINFFGPQLLALKKINQISINRLYLKFITILTVLNNVDFYVDLKLRLKL